MEDSARESFDRDSVGGDDSVHARYEWSRTPPLVAVVETISTAVGCDVEAVDSVYESVDPDALDALVRRPGRESSGDVHITFPYRDWVVTVHDSGEVVVQRDPLVTPAGRSDGGNGSRPGV
jgi:hypothetical protein